MKPINQQKNPGLVLLAIIAIFTLPFFFAWFLYQHPHEIPTSTTNHGYLINPPFQLSKLHIVVIKTPRINPLRVENNNTIFEDVVPGKWLVFTLNPDQCGQACQNSLYHINQIRLATNADQNRVITAVLNFNKPNPSSRLNQLLTSHYQETYNLRTNGTVFKKLVHTHIKHNYALLEGAIYIVDPLCNVILVYAPNTNPEFIYKDLHHLLGVSQIG